MRFSRRTLNIIIFCCLGIISWIHLGKTDPEQEPLERLELATLAQTTWQSWLSQEGITGYWQQVSSDRGSVRILLADRQINWLLSANNWSDELKLHISTLNSPKPDTTAILLQGPWAEIEMQAIAAYLIKQLQLQKPASEPENQSAFGYCEQTYIAGSRWFRDQWSASDPQLNRALPLRQQWQQFRIEQTRAMRQQWLSNRGQLDIQSDIAYHRPPAHYYQKLYQQLGDSQKTAAQEYLDCKQQIAAQ